MRGGIVLGLMMSFSYAALPSQPCVPAQPVIKLERVSSERIQRHQRTWDSYFTKVKVRTTIGYGALATAVTGMIAYCMLHKHQEAPRVQPGRVEAGQAVNHDAEIAQLLRRVVGDGTFAGWLKNSLISMGGMCVIGALLVAMDRLATPLTNGIARLWGQSPEAHLVQLTRMMLANRLRLDDSCTRLHALTVSSDLLGQKIRNYMMQDVMIDTDAFAHSFEDWIGYLGAALQRSSLDAAYCCQIMSSLNNLVTLINDTLDAEEKKLQGAATSTTHISGEIYNECVRMAHLMDMLLYGNKNTPSPVSTPAEH